MGPASVVLVHGSWHGPWVWGRVVSLLLGRRIEVHMPALPSVGANPAVLGDMHADAATVRDFLDRATGEVVLCGHSYGGVPVTEAAAGNPKVRTLVYLCGFMPDRTESLFSQLELADEVLLAPGNGVVVHDDGTHTIDPARAAEMLYHDCDEADTDWALGQLLPQAAVTGEQEPLGVAWRQVPSTYVICTEDRAVSPKLQRVLASRAGDVVEFPTSHSSMLSRPELVAALLGRLAQ